MKENDIEKAAVIRQLQLKDQAVEKDLQLIQKRIKDEYDLVMN